MSRRLWLTGALALSSVAVLGAQQQAPVFRTATRTVPVYVTVLDGNNRLVTDLTRDDFEVFDNRRPQPITLFDAGIQPISIVIMLDMSGSMMGNLPVLRNSAVQMFTRLLPTDKARVGNFGDRITLSERFTNDQNELIRALYLDLQPGGPTPLWGAVNTAMSALAPLSGRRVVLVLSDGKDTGALPFARITRAPITLLSVTARAQAEEFMVYGIGLASRGLPTSRGPSPTGRGTEPDAGLRDLAVQSGGGYFELDDTQNLGDTFARVADELHRQYLLGFAAPDSDGKVHQLDVRVRVPGLTVRARQSYVAHRRPDR
jgi:Ca-activated chloride channel homolog